MCLFITDFCFFALISNCVTLSPQTGEAERMHHTCADRKRRLQRLHGWIEQQKKQLNQRKHPTGQTLARKTLLDLEVQ